MVELVFVVSFVLLLLEELTLVSILGIGGLIIGKGRIYVIASVNVGVNGL